MVANPKGFLARIWCRTREPFRRFGLAIGLLYVVHRALNRLSSSFGVYPYQIFMQPLSQAPLLPLALAKNLRRESLFPGHPLLDIVQVPQVVLKERFAGGAQGLVALRRDDPLGYAWWRRSSYHESEVRCVFEIDDKEVAVFDFDVFVLPAHRMGLGFISVWHVLMEHLGSIGVTHSYSRISEFNLASLRAHTRLGGQVIDRIIFIRLGLLSVALIRRLPFVRVAWGSSAWLRMRLVVPTPRE